jgi:glycosyltransferase involved in cell wall biosynthesis
MRIGIVTSSLANTEIVNELRNYGKVKVICHKTEEVDGVESHPILPSPLSSPAKLMWYLPKMVKHLKDCEVIHCLVEPYAPLVALSNIVLRKPFFITAHGTYAVQPLSCLVGGRFLRFAYKRAHRILCVSKYTENRIKNDANISHTCVIPNGVNYELFAKKTDISHLKAEFAPGKIILSVGALKPRKGYDVMLKAFKMVKDEIANVKYLIIGDGSWQQDLRHLAKQLKIEEDVYFLGTKSGDELIQYYHLCDVYAHTPVNINDEFEGFGIVYLEAGACGKPVVASDSGGVPDAVLDGVTGLVVPEKDVEATAQALIRVLTEVELAKELGDNGRKRAKELSWDNIVKMIIEAYEEALSEDRNF